MQDSHAGEGREPAEHLITSDREAELIGATIYALRGAVDKLWCLIARTGQQIALAGLDRSQPGHLGNPKVTGDKGTGDIVPQYSQSLRNYYAIFGRLRCFHNR
jgi:hypothetical protein